MGGSCAANRAALHDTLERLTVDRTNPSHAVNCEHRHVLDEESNPDARVSRVSHLRLFMSVQIV